MKKYYLLFIVVFSLLIYSCSEEAEILQDNDKEQEEDQNTEDDDSVSEDVLETNQWINEYMSDYYFWNTYLPNIDYTQQDDPENYFYDLLYEEDRWSWITDDYTSLSNELSGVPVTMGYDPSFFLFSDGDGVFIVVNYVYPGSPAEEAGLERGDIILSIDNTELDTTNYYDLYSETSYSAELGKITGNTISYTGESLSLTASVIDADPAIYYDVFEIDGQKIGYLVYVEFVIDEDSTFLNTLDNIFDEYRAAGVSDLILDLRYNPGGEIYAASYLASEIAPSGVVSSEEILVHMQYNDDLQMFLESYEEMYGDYLSYRFTNDAANANMERVFVLTTSGTASASELLITGLEPYMEVVQIGESTYGKYTGAWVIPDDQEEWAMVPIVLKYSNVNGYTDFVDGLAPDYEVEDDLISAVSFGDTSDPMVAQAIELATGTSVATAMKTKSASLPPYRMLNLHDKKELKRNLIVPLLKEKE